MTWPDDVSFADRMPLDLIDSISESRSCLKQVVASLCLRPDVMLVHIGSMGGRKMRHGLRVLVAWLRVCTLGVALLLAAVPSARSSAKNVNETLTLMLGVGSTLALERSFDTILIDHPDVVDVRALDDRLVLLEPLTIGISNVVFVDKQGVAIANIRIVVCGARGPDRPASDVRPPRAVVEQARHPML